MGIGLRVLAFIVDMLICQFLVSALVMGVTIVGLVPAALYGDPYTYDESIYLDETIPPEEAARLEEPAWEDETTGGELGMSGEGGYMPLPFFFLPLMMPLMMAVYLLGPIVYFAIPTGLWGKTPGKLVFRLTVMDRYGRAPGIPRALGREALKFVAVATGIGIFFTLFQLLQQGEVWYDNLCDTEVEGGSLVPLTETQKNWRKLQRARR